LLQEHALKTSTFRLDANGEEKEQFVSNLFLKISDSSLCQPDLKKQNAEIGTSLIEIQSKPHKPHKPQLLLGFHQISLSILQTTGVKYIITGLFVLMATISVRFCLYCLVPKHRHLNKLEQPLDNINEKKEYFPFEKDENENENIEKLKWKIKDSRSCLFSNGPDRLTTS